MNSKRIEWIDTAKGLGITLVVLGHNTIPHFAGRFIFSFHMPLFFFLSGFLFNGRKYPQFSVFLKHKAKTLLLPYFVFNLLAYPYWIFVEKPAPTYKNIWIPIKGIFISLGTDNWLIHDYALWFLTSLFVTECIFYLILQLAQKDREIYLFMGLCLLVGVLIKRFLPGRLPWSADVAFFSIGFVGAGYLVRRHQALLHSLKGKLFIALFFLSYNLIFSLLNKGIYKVDMNFMEFGNLAYFYLSAFGGIGLMLWLAQVLARFGELGYLGRNSLLILGLHVLPIRLLRNQVSFGFEHTLFAGIVSAVIEISLLVPIFLLNDWLRVRYSKYRGVCE